MNKKFILLLMTLGLFFQSGTMQSINKKQVIQILKKSDKLYSNFLSTNLSEKELTSKFNNIKKKLRNIVNNYNGKNHTNYKKQAKKKINILKNIFNENKIFLEAKRVIKKFKLFIKNEKVLNVDDIEKSFFNIYEKLNEIKILNKKKEKYIINIESIYNKAYDKASAEDSDDEDEDSDSEDEDSDSDSDDEDEDSDSDSDDEDEDSDSDSDDEDENSDDEDDNISEYTKKFIKKYKNKLKPQNKKVFLKTVDRFSKALENEMDSSFWLDKKATNEQKIKKINLPDNAEVKMFTDIHSCAKPLKQFIAWMQFNGWTEKSDLFKITKKNGYLVFLGDYIDRGEEGVDVLNIVMKLFIKNPKKVILLRGNHEDNEIWSSYGFKEELEKIGIKDGKNKLDVLDKLPAMALLMNKKKCYMLSHASFDDSLNIKKLLKSNEEYQKITNSQSNQIRWGDFARYIKGFFGDMPDNKTFNSDRDSWKYIKSYFIKYCKEQTKNTNIKIVGFFRGHQHGSFKNELIDGNGLYFLDDENQWSGITSEPIFIKNLTKKEPFVLTIEPFRYSKYAGREGTETNKATIVTLKLNKKFSKSTISPEIMNQIYLKSVK